MTGGLTGSVATLIEAVKELDARLRLLEEAQSRAGAEHSGTATERIGALRGVTWEWRDDAPAEVRNQPGIGVLAQDVERVFPNLVVTRPDGWKAVDYSGLLGPLADAVGELGTRLDHLTGPDRQHIPDSTPHHTQEDDMNPEQPTDHETDDTEGHGRRSIAAERDETDDTEGHGIRGRGAYAERDETDDPDDTEGHRIYAGSDARLKRSITPLTGALALLRRPADDR